MQIQMNCAIYNSISSASILLIIICYYWRWKTRSWTEKRPVEGTGSGRTTEPRKRLIVAHLWFGAAEEEEISSILMWYKYMQSFACLSFRECSVTMLCSGMRAVVSKSATPPPWSKSRQLRQSSTIRPSIHPFFRSFRCDRWLSKSTLLLLRHTFDCSLISHRLLLLSEMLKRWFYCLILFINWKKRQLERLLGKKHFN